MKLNDFIAVMEAIAPQGLALGFDNVGLLVGPDHDEIRRVLVALDCTPVTAQEAVDTGADLLLTHHPVFFSGIKRFLPDGPETAAPYILVRHGVGHFAAHTNLDAAQGGVNDALASVLGLEDVSMFGAEGLCRIGTLPSPLTLADFAKHAARALETQVRFSGEGTKTVCRAAVLGGACGLEDAYAAKEAGADVFLTGEIRHHEALAALVRGIPVVAAGHYETERTVLVPLIKRLQELAPGVQYSLTHCETPGLKGLE